MTVNKRKKASRHRASHTHGWGSMKKHRGSGHKGGVGNAGSGKRSDAKKPSNWKEHYFGKKGFFSKFGKTTAINVSYLDENLQTLTKEGVAVEQSGKYLIDLNKMGFDKLLGSGKVKSKLVITVDMASKGAVEAVKSAGGEVQLKQ